MHIRPLRDTDYPMLARHRSRHSQENGREGDFIFAPSEDEEIYGEAEWERDQLHLKKEVIEPGWIRIWVLTDEAEIFGKIRLLNHPPMKGALHRSLLMMGIERAHRACGWGSKLMKEALNWAEDHPSLEWVGLYVFENNLPAKALYKKFGFEIVGTTKDMFRVFGKSVDDTGMVLKLHQRA